MKFSHDLIGTIAKDGREVSVVDDRIPLELFVYKTYLNKHLDINEENVGKIYAPKCDDEEFEEIQTNFLCFLLNLFFASQNELESISGQIYVEGRLTAR